MPINVVTVNGLSGKIIIAFQELSAWEKGKLAQEKSDLVLKVQWGCK